MSSSIKQRKFGSEVKNKAEESSKSENNKSFLAALLEGYEKNTNQTTKKFDKYVFLPGTISAFVFLSNFSLISFVVLTFLTNSKSTTFNKLLAIFGFFLGNLESFNIS